jgi:hypothetical protein
MAPLTHPNPTLTLVIPVYKGGAYWAECWASVLPVAHHFDQILVSLNYSELQAQDQVILETARPPNLRLIVQPQFLSAKAHGQVILDYYTTDYVFLLAHDDWLLPEGVAEARALLQTHGHRPISIFGAHAWGETEHSYAGVSRELAATPGGVSPADFVRADIDNFYSINMSGLIFPVAGYQRWKPGLQLFTEGFRADNFCLTFPGIERIFQTYQPSVRIRMHAGQAGASPNLKHRAMDNALYYFVQALYSADPFLVSRALEQLLLAPFRYRQPYAIWQVCRLLAASTRWAGRKHYGGLLRYLPSALDTFFRHRYNRQPRQPPPPG